MINLIWIQKIDAQAASYSAATSFTYTYEGYNYQFYYSGLVATPENYRFDSSALDYLLQKSAEGINISVSAGINSKVLNFFAGGLSALFNLYRNFVIATDKAVADWIVFDDIYGFEFQFTGIDSSYPGFETYGDAYGWRFVGWLGEKIDLVLDSQGMLYGSNPIGNYTFSDDQQEFSIWSIHQHDGDDIFWVPSVPDVSFNDFLPPYFVGDKLYFYLYVNGQPVRYHSSFSFVNTAIITTYHDYGANYYYSNPLLSFVTPLNTSYDQLRFVDDNNNTLPSAGMYQQSRVSNFTYNGISFSGKLTGVRFSDTFSVSTNLPNYFIQNPFQWASIPDFDYSLYNTVGYNNNSRVSGSGNAIFLQSLTTTPIPDPIVLPVDDPVPISDIDPDPIVFDPDPGDDPDPVPGIDYPTPGPTPVPVPPVPPLVSGNDDLWPDLNEVFAIESDMDSYLGGLSNFQFTPLRTLVEGFSSSLMWVSTIMMALYNGSDFSVLFVVLSIFFIAAALLGIYKWWTH